MPQTILTAKLPGRSDLFIFRESFLGGDGNCGFTLLGITRDEFASTFKPLAGDVAIREAISVEISEALTTELWAGPTAEWQDHFNRILHLDAEFQNTLVAIAHRLGLQVNQQADEFILSLVHLGHPADADQLRQADLEIKQHRDLLQAYCMRPDVFLAYIERLRIDVPSQRLWIGHHSCMVYAKVKNISLYLWRKASEASSHLTLEQSHSADSPDRQVIHGFHTGCGTHYNLLVLVNVARPVAHIPDSDVKLTAPVSLLPSEKMMKYSSVSEASHNTASLAGHVPDTAVKPAPTFQVKPEMKLLAAEIRSLDLADKEGETVADSLFLKLTQTLHDKTFSIASRKKCFALLISLANNGQKLADDVFEVMLFVIQDLTETEDLRDIAASVMLSSIVNGYQHEALVLVRQESLCFTLSRLLQHGSNLFIRTCAACALPYVLDKGAAIPEFLKYYLEEANNNHFIRPYLRGVQERLSFLMSDKAPEDLTSLDQVQAVVTEIIELEDEDSSLSQGKKTLDELLAELEYKNPERPINALFATELQSGSLRKQFEAIREVSQKQSSVLLTHPPIEQWDLDTCALWSKTVRPELKKKPDSKKAPEPILTLDPALMPEMIAVLCRVRGIIRNQQVRDIQIVSLLILLNAKDKGRLAEIATGEGKTALVAMFAAFKALQRRKVDVISSSSVLAHRDAEKERTFYEALGISVADTEDPESSYLSGLKSCYLADVVYGDITFQWDALRTEYQFFGTRGERPYDIAIVDEVDSMLIEEGAKLALLGGCQPDMEQLQPILIALWGRLCCENTPEHFIEQDGRLYWQANKESEQIEIEDKSRCLEHILEAHAKALISEKDSPILIPAHLKSFALLQAKYWAKSAVMAIETIHRDRDYVLTFDAQGTGSIAPIDFMNTGVTQLRSAWTNGLHQFLQIKHGLAMTPETVTTSFISNRHYFSRYGTDIYGVTGTLGGEDAQLLLTEVYPLDLVFIPTFKEKQLTMVPGILAEDEAQWFASIIASVRNETEAGRAVLVICETNLLVTAVEKKLESAGILKLRHYARSDLKEHAASIRAMGQGEVLISTSLGGRGTDLKISEAVKRNKGLHVCLTYLPNKRGRDQAYGRTARQGQEGSAQLIVNKKEIEARFSSGYFLLGQADTLDNAVLWRDNIEEARLRDIKQYELKKVMLQEHLFDRFCQVRKQLRAIEDNRYRLADLEERWGFWLKNIDNQMLDNDSPDEAAIIAAYEQFEREAYSAYMEHKFQNPGYLISEGNHLSSSNPEQGMAAYQEAANLDPVFAFVSYYLQAQHYIMHKETREADIRFKDLGLAGIAIRANYYKTRAVECLKKAQEQIETHLLPQIQTTLLMYSTTLESENSKNALLKQYKDKELVLQKILENILESIAIIEQVPSDYEVVVGNNTSLFNLFPGEEPPEEELAALCRMGLTHLVNYDWLPPEEDDSLFDAFICAVWGIAQIVVGVCLTLSGQIALGGFLISEGLGDVIFVAQSLIATGSFSWKDYGMHKQISLAISAITFGISYVKTAVAEQAAKKAAAQAGTQVAATTASKELSRAALVEVAKKQVVHAVVSAGIHQVVNLALDAVTRDMLANFKEDIEKHVRNELNAAMSDPALKEAVYTLLSLDFHNRNQYGERQIQQIVSNLLTTHQSRLRTIVSAVVDGVLRRECPGLAAVKTVIDIAHVTDQLTDFCDRFCSEFKERVRFLAHKNSAGQTVVIEESYCKPRCDTIISSITNDLRQYITRSLHQGVVKPALGMVSAPLVNKGETKVLDAISKMKPSAIAALEHQIKEQRIQEVKEQQELKALKEQKKQSKVFVKREEVSAQLQVTVPVPKKTRTRSEPGDRQFSGIVPMGEIGANKGRFTYHINPEATSSNLTTMSISQLLDLQEKRTVSIVPRHVNASSSQMTTNPRNIPKYRDDLANLVSFLDDATRGSSVRQTVKFGLDYVGGGLMGAAQFVGDCWQVVRHPINNFLEPVGSFIWDVNIIYSANAPPSAPGAFLSPAEAGFYDWPEPVIPKDSVLYRNAVSNMQARYDGIVDGLTSYVNAPTEPERMRMAMRGMLGFFMPALLAKPLANISAIANVRSIPKSIIFNDRYNRTILPRNYIDYVSAADVRAIPDGHLLYVTVRGETGRPELRMIKTGSNGFEIERGVYKHPDIAQGAQVLAAGEVRVYGGKIRTINNKAGHYVPQGEHLKLLVEDAFVNSGLPEARGRFTAIPEALTVTNNVQTLSVAGSSFFQSSRQRNNLFFSSTATGVVAEFGRNSLAHSSEPYELARSPALYENEVVSRCITDSTCKLLRIVPPEVDTRFIGSRLLVKNKAGDVLDVDLLRELTRSRDMNSLVICREGINSSTCRPVDLPAPVTENIIRYLREHRDGNSFACYDFATHPRAALIARTPPSLTYTDAVLFGVTKAVVNCWTFVKDTVRLGGDAALIAAVNNPSVPEPLSTFLQHFEFYQKPLQRMHRRGEVLNETVNSLARFTFDAAVIHTAHSGEMEECFAGATDVLRDSPLYLTARSRMQDRGEVLARAGQAFMAASGPERTEVVTQFIVESCAPGTFLRGAQKVGKIPSNLRAFGMVKEPPRFMNQHMDDLPLIPVQIERLNPSQVKALGSKDYKWVLTEDGEFFVAAVELKNPVIRQGEVSMQIFHHEVANFKPVYMAGEFTTNSNGIITSLTPYSGHYMPSGPHLQKLIERTFLRNGFSDIVGKYKPLDIPYIGSPIIMRPKTPSLTSTMVTYVVPAAGIAVSRSNNSEACGSQPAMLCVNNVQSRPARVGFFQSVHRQNNTGSQSDLEIGSSGSISP